MAESIASLRRASMTGSITWNSKKFPTNHKKNSTVRILKTPKTESSVRKIFLPKSVANMLVDWKAEQDEMKEILGDEYMDYNLVMASTFGLPLGDGAIRGPLKKLIEDYNLPPVVFHSFRHSSVTYTVSYTHLRAHET